MNGKTWILLVFHFSRVFYVNFAVNSSDLSLEGDEASFENGFYEIRESSTVSVVEHSNPTSPMNSTLHKTVKRFTCAVENLDDAYLLVYGTKAWAFPRQDVNLRLSYPSASDNNDQQTFDTHRYLITSLQVILYTDGTNSKGYITSGGILQNSISLSFVSSNITMLSYQFWLYGVPFTSSSAAGLSSGSAYLC